MPSEEKLDDPVLCNPNICDPVFTGKRCKCFASVNTKSPFEDQFCGFRDGDRIVACDPGCCKPMCPRMAECPSIPRREPDAIVRTRNMNIVTDRAEVEKKYSVDLLIKRLIYIIVSLVILSTLSMLIPRPKISLKNMLNSMSSKHG